MIYIYNIILYIYLSITIILYSGIYDASGDSSMHIEKRHLTSGFSQ